MTYEIINLPRKTNITHGMTKSSEFSSWQHIKDRCLNPKSDAYENYGGRGIKVCDRWLKFKNFYADMGAKPSPKHSIDRINNSIGYFPENCRWATMRQQSNNRRNNVCYKFNGESLTIPQWSRRTGIPVSTIGNRIKHGWPINRVLNEPPWKGQKRLFHFNGQSLTIPQWGRILGINCETIRQRINKLGWSVERALTEPVHH